jgi:cAMP-dependent protein kinase regulator
MFQNLDDKELSIVTMAMEQFSPAPGEHVIKQGEAGDCLYIVEEGLLKCFKLFPGNTEETYLLDYKPGMAFGELALLYNTNRQASIIAHSQGCVLWRLDRGTFNSIVKDAAVRRREMYEDFLKKVTLLSSMEPYERVTVSDAFVQKKFRRGEYVIREGQTGSDFFFVVEGEAAATKDIGGKETEVMKYQPGDYFGERALIKNEPRAANIVARSESLTTVSLDKDTFKRTLGNLEDIFRRNMEIYCQFQGASNE